jgi:hypothetical protein
MSRSKHSSDPKSPQPSPAAGSRPDRPPRISRRSRVIFLTIILVALAPLPYGLSVFDRGWSLYHRFTASETRWKGKVYQFDPQLGFAPIPGASGSQLLPIGPEIPTRFDADGFRVPLDRQPPPPGAKPLVLALGCSFTFGAFSPAEETFPFLVGQQLGGASINAGVSGYGLTQMLVLARRLIPLHRPDYVLVQLSPWLAKRALSPFGPTYFGKLPTPYLIPSGTGFAIAPPVFSAKIFDLPVSDYEGRPTSTAGSIRFLKDVAVPLYVHDDFNLVLYRLKKRAAILPVPASDPQKAAEFVYREILKTCLENHAVMVIVILDDKPRPQQLILPYTPDQIVVNAQAALLNRLPRIDNETYFRTYAHFRGEPLRLVDKHPNAAAHRIIASEIVTAIAKYHAVKSAPP